MLYVIPTLWWNRFPSLLLEDEVRQVFCKLELLDLKDNPLIYKYTIKELKQTIETLGYNTTVYLEN